MEELQIWQQAITWQTHYAIIAKQPNYSNSWIPILILLAGSEDVALLLALEIRMFSSKTMMESSSEQTRGLKFSPITPILGRIWQLNALEWRIGTVISVLEKSLQSWIGCQLLLIIIRDYSRQFQLLQKRILSSTILTLLKNGNGMARNLWILESPSS
jgi:hypothetical protein